MIFSESVCGRDVFSCLELLMRGHTCVFLCHPRSLIDDQKGRIHAVVLNRVSSAFEME